MALLWFVSILLDRQVIAELKKSTVEQKAWQFSSNVML